jgi:hypothetical protein
MKKSTSHNTKQQIAIYQTLGEEQKIYVRIEDENVWLTQKLIAELFAVDVRTVNEHLKNIYDEKELLEQATIRNFRIVQKEAKRDVVRDTKHYNLDSILAVGYRVRSERGAQFRTWATEKLREYLIKGFTMDDERLKQGGGRARYFTELLQRVRDIRSSERMFHQKVTDIYATSIDYKVDAEATQKFFATVQNKMHFAVHGYTAAEIITLRANSTQPMMGLTSFKNEYLTIADIAIAKNYLTEGEINTLNLIVSVYIDFAELQANSGRLMKMQDWIHKLDEFLKISEKEILKTAGKVRHEDAMEKAEQEFEKYAAKRNGTYISDFDREVKKMAEIGKKRTKQSK